MKKHITLFFCSAAMLFIMSCADSKNTNEMLQDTLVVPDNTNTVEPADTTMTDTTTQMNNAIDSTSAYGTEKKRSTAGSTNMDKSSAYGTVKNRSKVDTSAHYKKEMK